MGAGIGAGVPVERLAREHVEADAADPRRGAGEVLVDQLGGEADGLEDLRARVGLDRRDPHLRDRLEQALGDALDAAILGLVHAHALGQAVLRDQLRERLEHHVRVDRGRAVADQRREVVDLARLAGLEHEAGLQARALADEVVVHPGDRQQRRDRHALGAEVAVGEDEDVDAAGDRLGRLRAYALHGRREPLGPTADRPGDVERVRLEDRRVDLAQLLELVRAQDRRLHRQLVRVLGRLVEQVALRADAGGDAHHDRLADRVDRRVRDLREELLEVGEQRRLAVGEHGQREVVAHRADRLGGAGRGRAEQHAQVLLRVAERELAQAQRLGARHGRLGLGQVGEPDDAVAVPVAVGLARRDVALDLLVGDDAPRLEVDEEQLAGLQAALADDVGGRLVHHAGLGAEHDPAVLGLQPAAGAQAVAVERRPDHAAVGERDRRGAVPRLHQTGVERVEALEVVGQVVAALERLRDHHHHRVGQRAPRQHEQLEHVVERRRVRATRAHDRQQLREVPLAEQLGRELGLAGAHPVDVAAQRVDLAVVGDVAVRVRELPARERVGREARVDEAQRGLGALVLQVGVVAEQLRGREHALVDDRAARERRHHEVRPGGQLGHAADDVELALEGVLVVQALRRRRGDHELLDVGREVVGGDADVVLVDRDVAPADHALALGLDRAGQQRLELGAALVVLGQEADGHAVAARGREVVADDSTQQLVGELEQDARAVAGVGVRARRPAVLEVLQGHDRALDGLVARLAVEAGDHGDAAGVVLIAGVVQANRPGRSPSVHGVLPVRGRGP